MSKSTKPTMFAPIPDASENYLNLMNEKVKEVMPKQNTYEHRFIPGQGEVVVQFRNFSKQKKYFFFSITECDADGWPLAEKEIDGLNTVQQKTLGGEVAAEISDAEMDKIDQQLAAESPL